MRASARARSRSERSIERASRPPAGCSAGRGSRSSRPPPRRGCRSRCPPRPRARACAGARAGRRRPGRRADPRRRSSSAPGGASSSSPISAITPSRTSRSAMPSRSVRGSSRRAPRISTVAAGTGERSSSSAAAHAGCGSRLGGASRTPDGAPPPPAQQLVEHRHPHDHSGLDLLDDQRLRRVDHLGGQLDAAVDRAGVHQQLVGPQPAAVDLVLGGVLAQRRDERAVHALVLHPQRVDHVRLAQLVERRARPGSRATRSRAASASAGRRP